MSRIHMLCGTKPNESDTEGDQYLLCGTEAADPNCTDWKELVDCKRCLKRMRNESNDDHTEGK